MEMPPEHSIRGVLRHADPGGGAGKVIMLRYSLVLVVALGSAGAARAASWADGLFDELSRDFGSVVRGETQIHRFRLVNKTRSPVNIYHVRVSCGCTTAFAKQTYLQPNEETYIEARMDTSRFIGVRSVTIFVQFDRPRFEEVRLWVQANARNDFTVSPATLTVGQVKRGSTPTTSVSVSFYGNPGARITEAKGESNYVRTTVKEVRRQETEVVYQLTAKLRGDTPVGKWYTDVWVKTNLAAIPQVRVPLTVEVESALSVSPPTVTFGIVKVKDETERRVIVRGVKRFKIVKVDGGDAQVQVRNSTSGSREVHVLTIKLNPATGGDFNRLLRVKTDLGEDSEIDFRVLASVSP
jgi:hypothetical protein